VGFAAAIMADKRAWVEYRRPRDNATGRSPASPDCVQIWPSADMPSS